MHICIPFLCYVTIPLSCNLGSIFMSKTALMLCFVLCFFSPFGQSQIATSILEIQQQGKNQQDYYLYLSQDHVANINKQQQLQELYNRASKTLYILDHQQQSYRIFNQEKAQNQANNLQAMLVDLEKKISQLPESQKQQQVEKLNKLLNMGKNLVFVESHYKATNKQEQFAGVSCDWYEIKEQKIRVGKTCIAEPNTIKHGTALLEMLQTMNNIYDLIAESMQGKLQLNLPNNPMAPLAKLGKIPFSIENQNSNLAMQLIGIQETKVRADLFALPSNFKKID